MAALAAAIGLGGCRTRAGEKLAQFLDPILPGDQSKIEIDPSAIPGDVNLAVDTVETRTALKEDLRVLDTLVTATLQDARRRVAAVGGDKDARKRADKWLASFDKRAKQAVKRKDPLAALLDIWALDHRTADFLAKPEGEQTLGVHLPVVAEATLKIHDATDKLVREYLPPDAVNVAEKQLGEYVANRPLQKPRSLLGRLLDPFGFGKELFSAVSGLASIPLAPTRAISSLRRGTNEIAKFNVTANRFTDVVKGLPASTREELERLLSTGDRFTTISQTVRDARDAAQAINQAMATADNLTSGVKDVITTAGSTAGEFSGTAAAAGEAAQNFSGTAQAVGDTADRFTRTAQAIDEAAGSLARAADSIAGSIHDSSRSVTGTTADFRKTAESIDRAAKSIGDAAKASRELVASIRDMRSRGGGGPAIQTMGGVPPNGAGAATDADGHHPFDPREYNAAAQSIEEGANAVTNMLLEIRAIQEHNDEVREKKKRDAEAQAGAVSGNAPPADRPFQPLDYKLAADAISGSAENVRGTLTKIEDLVDSGKLQTGAEGMRSTLEPFVVMAVGRAQAITDYVVIRVALLILLIFGLAVIFVVFKRRLPPRPGE